MVKCTEAWLQEGNGPKLYTKIWTPDSPPPAGHGYGGTSPRAYLAFIHGFSDHCNAYYDLFPTLADTYKIEVRSFDQRGWGRSVEKPSQKGLTGPTPTVLSDIRQWLQSFTSVRGEDDPPLFLMGHSMGGAEALHFMMSTSPRQAFSRLPLPHIHGLLLECPFVALHPDSQPNSFTVWAGKLAARVAPHRQMLQSLDSSRMSRDPQVRKDWEDDKLCHDTGTLEGLAGMLERAAELRALGDGKTVQGLKLDPGCPVWLGHGSEDKVCSFDEAKKLFERLEVKDKTFREYKGAYHKMHAEPEGVKEEFVKDVGEWIFEHLPEKWKVQTEDVRPKL